MNKVIQEFYENLLKKPEIKEKLSNELKGIKSELELKQVIKREIMPIVREKKLNFTENDLVNYEKESMRNLDIEEIQNVSGGVSAKSVVLSSGLLMLTAIGTGVMTGRQADAAIPKDLIVETVQMPDDRADVGAQAVVDQEGQEGIEERQEAALQEEGGGNEEAGVPPQGGMPQEGVEVAAVQGNQVDNGEELELVTTQDGREVNEEAVVPPQGGMPQANVQDIEGILQQSNNKYIMEALNLLDPYLLKISGTTERFRFLDGNTEEIQFGQTGGDGLPCWDYKKSAGEGSPNFMVSLFPSSGGILNSSGGNIHHHPFTEDCAPTPELVAKIAVYIHNYIRCEDQQIKNQAHQDLENLLTMLPSLKFKNVKDSFLQLIAYFDEIEKLDNTTDEGTLNNIYEELVRRYKAFSGRTYKGKKPTPFENIYYLKRDIGTNGEFTRCQQRYQSYLMIQEFFNKYLGIDLNLIDTLANAQIGDTVQENIKNGRYIKTILHILHNAEHMIDEQEKKENEQGRLLPKYTTERMLMSYFIDKFATKKDIQQFYTTVSAQIEATTEESNTEAALARVRNLRETLDKLSLTENIPYRSKAYENGSACKICRTEDGESFVGGTFADCADTTVRHVMNLLAYDYTNPGNEWSYILENLTPEKKKLLDEGIREILSCMNNGETIKSRSLKEKLELFFYFQAKESELGACVKIEKAHQGVDDDSIIARSFWNYVISNMDQNTLDGYYRIEYVQGGNELSTGYEDCLKLIYNLIYALKGDSGDLNLAKGAIDAFSAEQSEQNLVDALEKTLRLIRRDIDVQIISNNENNYGTVEIKMNQTGFSFEISQYNGHAYVDFAPIGFEEITDPRLEEFIETDLIAQTISGNWKNTKQAELIKFNALFSRENYNYSRYKKTRYVLNYAALKALKKLQGEGNNRGMIDYAIGTAGNCLCFDTSIKAILQDQSQESLNLFLFMNYEINPYSICPADAKELKNKMPKYFTADNKNPLYRAAKEKGLIYFDETNRMEYLCRINADGTVHLCPLVKTGVQPSEIIIPARVQLAGREYQVTRIFYGWKFFEELKKSRIEPAIELKEGIQSFYIGRDTFADSSLQSITFPEGLQTLDIGYGAFYECEKLARITFPKSLQTLGIGMYAFYRCKGLTEITFPEGTNVQYM